MEELRYPDELDPGLEEAERRGGGWDAGQQTSPAGPKFALEPLSGIQPDLNGFWLIKGLVPASGLMVAYGEPGCGKSFLVLDAALHIAAGREWAGRRTTQVGVIYIASEGTTAFRKRVFAAKREHRIPNDTPFALITVAPNLGTAAGDREILIRDIRAGCAALGFQAGMVVLDTVARSIAGADENSSKDIGIFVDNADAIGKELRALVLGVHHSGKDADRGMRGSSALHGATDAEWEIRANESDGTVKVPKMKDGPSGFSFLFHRHEVEVGKDVDGDRVTTLIVDVSTSMKQNETTNAKRLKLTGQRAEFFKAVRMAIDEMGGRVPSSDHTPSNVRGVLKSKIPLYAAKLGFLADAKNERVRRATCDRHIRDLAGSEYIAQWDEWVWLVAK